MPGTCLLLLSSLLATPLVATGNPPLASSEVQVRTTDGLTVLVAGDQPLLTSERPADFAGEADGICYKIRAYIFTRDDDHAPALSKSTTCGPRQPHTKNVMWPKARLVPAD